MQLHARVLGKDMSSFYRVIFVGIQNEGAWEKYGCPYVEKKRVHVRGQRSHYQKKKEAAKRKDKETDENCELVIGHVYSYLEV